MDNKKELNNITRIRYDKKMIRFASIVFVVSVLITIACKIFVLNYMFGDYSSETESFRSCNKWVFPDRLPLPGAHGDGVHTPGLNPYQ